MSNLCPKCLKDDQVQKVSAIVASGIYSTTYQVPAQGEIAGHKVFGTIQQTGTGITELAQKLAIDFSKESIEESRKKTVNQDMLEFVKANQKKAPKDSIVTTGLQVIAAIIMIAVWLIYFPTLAQIRPNPYQSLINLTCIFGTGVGIGLFFVAGALNSREKKAWNKSFNQITLDRRKETTENYVRTVERAKHRYSNSYYCHRDDIVFVPGETLWADASEIMDFVFQ